MPQAIRKDDDLGPPIQRSEVYKPQGHCEAAAPREARAAALLLASERMQSSAGCTGSSLMVIFNVARSTCFMDKHGAFRCFM